MWKYKSKMGVTGRSSWKESIMRLTHCLQVDNTALTKFDFELLYLALGWPVQQEVEKKKLQWEQIMFLFLSTKKNIIVYILLLKVN